MKKIIIDDAVPFAKEIFGHLGQVICRPGKSISSEDVKAADALVIRSRTEINQSLLDKSAVEFVGSTVVGLDHVDQNYLKQNHIHFYSAQGCNANSVAEFVMTQMIMMAEEKGFELADKTLAIIGVGNVGARLQRKAQTLGMTVLLNDPPRQKIDNSDEFCDLKTALTADIISFHTPLTKAGDDPTYHLLSAEQLKKISPNQIIINAARGGIIDENAWAKTSTLINLIDCWENEPDMNQALYQTARMATPHIAGHSLDAKINGSEMVYQALCDYWKIAPQTNWQKKLPLPPQPIEAQGKHIQTILCSVFTQAHNPEQDDIALRSTYFSETLNQFENYRRNYPVYREWSHQRVIKTQYEEVNQMLSALGFSLLDKSQMPPD